MAIDTFEIVMSLRGVYVIIIITIMPLTYGLYRREEKLMRYRKHTKRTARLLSVVIAVITIISLMPIATSARESGNTVLLEDYYGLCDGNAVKVPGLTYRCSGHGDKMVPYYVEEENDYIRTIPGIIEQVGNKIRYIKDYYCPSCYNQFKSGTAQVLHGNSNKSKEELGIDGGTLDDYFQYLGEHDLAFLADCGFYYGAKDDFEHIPKTNGNGTGGNSYAPAGPTITDEIILSGGLHSNKALPEPYAKQPDSDDPIGNWDVLGAWTFYQFYYTGMRKIINKPATADDPAWDTVRDTTRIYYMQRQAENQTYACRIDYTGHWYNFDYSKLADWRITDLMAEYSTGEICGYATYVGSQSEVAVPETINIPIYGDVKVIGLDIENHNLTKVYVNDNVTCIRRLSSVNLEEISGCKNLEYIEKYAFQNDVSLKTIPEMPKLDWIAMGAFEGCISLRDIKLPDNMTFIDFTAFGWYDTVLGNYDIGMDVESWEAFQYLRDLSDNDKILGITLYAKKGSTTYTLLDTLINKNDALTPALDNDGKPYFRSYGDTVAMMSGEVKNYTSHWNLKSSGDYKGSVASTDKDVDDSTNGRLGEYDGSPTFEDLIKDPVGWLKQLIGMGGTAFLLLLFLLSFLGFSGGKYESDSIKFKICWGLITVDYDKMLKAADRNRTILETLDKLSSLQLFDKFGKYGELFDAGVGVSKALQKAADVYGEKGNWREALVRGAGSYGAGQLVGKATKTDPSLAIWDIATSEIFKGSAAADMVNAGNNAENLFDYFLDLAHTASSDTRAEGVMDTVFGGKSMSYGELADKMMNGDYGDNIKNLVDAEDILLAENNGDLYNAVFGEEGMGIGEFLMGFGDTAEDALIKGNGSAERGLENYRKLIERFYSGKGGAK